MPCSSILLLKYKGYYFFSFKIGILCLFRHPISRRIRTEAGSLHLPLIDIELIKYVWRARTRFNVLPPKISSITLDLSPYTCLQGMMETLS